MVRQILQKITEEVSQFHNYELTEFQLGENQYNQLIEEAKVLLPRQAHLIKSITDYAGVPIKKHKDENAIVYSIAVKRFTRHPN